MQALQHASRRHFTHKRREDPDYLAAGHTVDDLYKLAEDELRPLAAENVEHRPVAWPAAWLLGSVEKLLRRFVVFPSEHDACALSLYVLHTWAIDAAACTPYMLIVSPEKRSGKTRVLETVELVVREPLRAGNISAAGVFQSIEKWRPTLLVDELDAIFTAKSESAEALRGVLNAGNRRGSFVVRGSQDGEPVRFSTFCPKLMAGINVGKIPDTIRDRSIVLALERKRRDERVDDLFPTELADTLDQLRGRLDDWATENSELLAGYRRTERIHELDDRLQESWDPLLAIAAHADAGWPARAAAAAVALAGGAVDPSDEALGHTLLVALKAIYADTPALSSKAVCQALNEDDELPLGEQRRGEGINQRGLSKLLKPYGVRPRTVRVGAETARGYHQEQFADAWARYAPEPARAREQDPLDVPTHPTHPTHPRPEAKIHPTHDPTQLKPYPTHGPDVSDGATDVSDDVLDGIPDGNGDVSDVLDVLAHVGGVAHARVSFDGDGPTLDDALNGAGGAVDCSHREKHRARGAHDVHPDGGRVTCSICHPVMGTKS